MQHTIGTYLAQRLNEIGITDYFAIPGDYNLTLLDELLSNKKLNMISCCNELNAGYAADGYARANGISALAVTFSVGALSAINAIAGCYAENLPVIVISGGPNTNSFQDNEVLHHSLGEVDYTYVRDMYQRVTSYSTIIHDVSDAPIQIDKAITMALQTRKPVYIEIACNIADFPIGAPSKLNEDVTVESDIASLNAAVKAASERLNKAVKPVVVAGSKTRYCDGGKLIEKLCQKTKYAMAVMPDAKGFVNEQHKQFIGIYWGPVSSPGCSEIIESSDCYLFVGPNFNDYTTTGHSNHLVKEKMISVYPNHVKIGDRIFTQVAMPDFLNALSKKLKINKNALDAYHRIAGRAPLVNQAVKNNSSISTRVLYAEIQAMLNSHSAVLAETGDSWFNGIKLELPKDAAFEIQMQYGSIGWSVGALLGYQLGSGDKTRAIGLIGDGSFQMTAQEVSTMLRYDLAPIIFLMNNSSYTIEVQIHDGPYNQIKNWDYTGLIKSFAKKEKTVFTARVKTVAELKQAIKTAKQKKVLCFIEVMLDPDDCNKNLLEWGARVASNNGRRPRATF